MRRCDRVTRQNKMITETDVLYFT